MNFREIGKRALMCFFALCIICGILLMMCESEDWNTQKWTLLGGFGLFILGALPMVYISQREGDANGYD